MSDLENLKEVANTAENADTCVVIRQMASRSIELASAVFTSSEINANIVGEVSLLLARVSKVVARAYASAEAAAEDGDEGSLYETILIHNSYLAVCNTMFRFDVMAERMLG